MVTSKSGFVLTEKTVKLYFLFDLLFEESILRGLGRGICGSFSSCFQFVSKKSSNGNFLLLEMIRFHFIGNDEDFILLEMMKISLK